MLIANVISRQLAKKRLKRGYVSPQSNSQNERSGSHNMNSKTDNKGLRDDAAEVSGADLEYSCAESVERHSELVGAIQHSHDTMEMSCTVHMGG